MEQKIDRRAFIKAMGIGAAGITAALLFPQKKSNSCLKNEDHNELNENIRMPKRRLGKTEFEVSLLALGGQGIMEQPKRFSTNPSVNIINRAIDLGVNYIDTSALYGGGLSEKRIGKVMKNRRNEVFLATKTHDRTYDGTLRLAEQSLERLQTDHIDLYQIHNIRLQDDLDTAFSKNGAIRAMERLRNEGVIRFIGITGHRDPDILLRGIKEYPFDTILMSLNAGDIHYKPFQTELLKTAVEKDMGIIAMKVTGKNRLFRDDGLNSMRDALHYVYSFPISTAVVGISAMCEIEQNVKIAKSFRNPLSPERIADIEDLTKHYKEEANWFKIEWY
ncbi:aldo/keto reductase [Marispirochaeta aestuarii]|uniref:aldo/keto reductase n=1 Tax=Marispirochaeta aestuarii TaxID=1963862 RepID=UPI0029C94FE3|nr:aldo/keto reductase [Marispirochaeta aestuarii]